MGKLRTLLRSAVSEDEHLTLVLRFTLVLLVLYGPHASWTLVPIRTTCGLLLVFPRLLRFGPAWWLLAVVVGVSVARDWYVVDNHKYLISYWTALCAVAVTARSRDSDVARVARLLVAVVFCLATLWKIVAFEYFDGSFLYWTFLTDGRLQRLAATISGIPLTEIAAEAEAAGFAAKVGGVGTAIPVMTSEPLVGVAVSLSWLGLLVEGGIGALHVSGSHRLYGVRHLSLMLFLTGTYFLLPVAGFAFILMIVGFAQVRPDHLSLKLAYLLVFACMQLTVLPWQRWFLAP